MNKIFVAAVAVSLVAMASFAVSTSADEPEVLWYVDTPDGVVTISQSDLDWHEACGGDAAGLLGDFYCNNGDHTRDAFFFGHACASTGDFTGVVDSVLAHDGADRHWQCTYENGSLTATDGFGDWPPSGAMFRHDCWSYESGTGQQSPLLPGLGTILTGGESQTDPHGLPGGVGGWQCILIND